jgi:diaminohydroxyphosphoribosylaminopyrimidine deaminase / 5-amino-6-(5-phosphoribosylamino)uracil reductase
MERALKMAQQSVGVSSPNPAVGCVLVKNGNLIGEGFHIYEQKDHAEIAALKAATDSPQGATAYVTLEPCSHTGRTGPCSEALIKAGIRRVVTATGDPNPLVHGQGFEKMRAAGIEVAIGIGQERARQLNDGFARWIQAGIPFVTLKTAMTLDGRIAPATAQRTTREPWWITGEDARVAVQAMRHGNDAILTGVDTVIADDPLLTDRSGLPRHKPLRRIVLDSHLRIPSTSKILENVSNNVTIFTTTSSDEKRKQALEARGVEVVTLSPMNGHVSLEGVFAHLGRNKILSVLIEAGTRLNTALLRGGYIDRLRLFIAPMFLGSGSTPVVEELNEPIRFTSVKTTCIGDDLAWDVLLRDPWREAVS